MKPKLPTKYANRNEVPYSGIRVTNTLETIEWLSNARNFDPRFLKTPTVYITREDVPNNDIPLYNTDEWEKYRDYKVKMDYWITQSEPVSETIITNIIDEFSEYLNE